MKKLLFLLLALAFITAPAIAGNRPEFDAVGDDSTNFFNDKITDYIAAVAFDGFGVNLAANSSFTVPPFGDTVGTVFTPWEFFKTQAGVLAPDPCFWFTYLSALTDAYNEGVYEWQIVLQMKPETDLDVQITDCVLKHNVFDLLMAADQTGRYRAPWGQLIFVPSANPSITVKALPGKYATPGFTAPVILDARTLPGLTPVALNGVLYTSKAVWAESLPIVLPATGTVNASGQPVFNLKQGDKINVKVTIPFNNTVDVRYGKDNVVVKYVGIVGTEFDTINF